MANKPKEYGFDTVVEVIASTGYVVVEYHCGFIIHSDCLKFPLFCPLCGTNFEVATLFPKAKEKDSDVEMKFHDFDAEITERK